MKNKTTVLWLLGVFVLICCYNLYWTYQQYSLEQQFAPYGKALDSLNAVKPDTLSWNRTDFAIKTNYDSMRISLEKPREKAAQNSFTLGLDLQGGMYVTMEVKIEDLLKEIAADKSDTTFLAALECATQRRSQVAQPYVDAFLTCFDEKNSNGQTNLGVIFYNDQAEVDNQTVEIGFDTDRSTIETYLRQRAEAAMANTVKILRTRIDQFGVVSPNLQPLDNNRILLELPGIKDEERVKKLLRQTAQLEFYACHTFRESYPILTAINSRLAELYSDSTELTGDATEATESDPESETPEEATNESDPATTADPDSGAAANDTAQTDTAQAQTWDTMSEEERRKFIAENPLFYRLQQLDYSRLGQSNLNTPLVGFAQAQYIDEINRMLAHPEIQNIIPEDMKFVWGFYPQENSNLYELIAVRVGEEGRPALSGEVVENARQDVDQYNNVVVSMNMDEDGTREWARITETNVGKHVAIVLDGRHYSYPVINEKIPSGRTQISGGFTIQDAKDLANVLEAGQLPVTTRIEGSQTVGPTLGRENIQSGLNSFLYAFVVILIFMMLYYAKAGIISDLALLANLLFILGCSAAFTVVFTLPGMAAVVLTVGMAVDANVLIFERIREEQKRGKTLKASIKSGFSNAFSSVMDANITTFLTGVVLFAFGVGPIRGFAVMLMIGILTSLISALIITRLILDYYAGRGGQSLNFGFSWTTSLFDKIKINMIGLRKTFYIVSAIAVTISLASILTSGFKYGVDFSGGRQYKVVFTDAEGNARNLSSEDVQQLRVDLTASFDNNLPVIKTTSADNQVYITTSFLTANTEGLSDSAIDVRVQERLRSGINTNYGSDKGYAYNIPESTYVGASVANDIKEAAVSSVIFSVLIIFFYILLRFRKWQYSLGAVIAVFHDVLITLGIFSILKNFDLPFSVEIDQALIAALLTIVGYSINDTVVVFDRIRENINEMKASALKVIYNESIDQTISRTLITSVTTFITVLILFFFGGDTIKGFTFAIIIGIVVGTYSSIFVASPISLDLLERSKGKEAK